MGRPKGSGVRSLADRFGEKWTEDPETGCHVWTGAIDSTGYGRIYVGGVGRTNRAHRVIFMLNGVDIPSLYEVDHLCRNRACVNIDHLEMVTSAVNVARGESCTARNAAVTHCPRGHEYTEENTYLSRGSRWCRTCRSPKRQRALAAVVGLIVLQFSVGCDVAAWARVAKCESGNNPAAVSSSGRYMGLYQFDQRTWDATARSTGRADLVGVRPSSASRDDQTAQARALYAVRGRSPWPRCGRYLP